MTNFDYYIVIDFSENLIGYNIIESKKFMEILPKITRFRHYKEVRDKKLYLKNVRNTVKRENLRAFFLKFKIKEMSKNMDIYTDVLEFIKKNDNCIVFISVDNRQYSSFRKIVDIVDGWNVIVKQESELVKGTPEYQVSLVLDNLLNIERLKDKK